MKHIIKVNKNSKYGYDYVTIDDNNVETVKELTSKTTDNYFRISIPEYNIKMIAIKTIENNLRDDEYVIEPREACNTNTLSIGSWQNYLNDEEKAIIEGIKQKCVERKQAAIESSKPTEADKLRAQIRRLEEKLAKM